MSRAPRDIGDRVRIAVAFRDSSGFFGDPTTITYRNKNITLGTVTEYIFGVNVELVKDSTGNYHVDWTYPSAGVWVHQMKGAGAIGATTQVEEIVEEDATA